MGWQWERGVGSGNRGGGLAEEWEVGGGRGGDLAAGGGWVGVGSRKEWPVWQQEGRGDVGSVRGVGRGRGDWQ